MTERSSESESAEGQDSQSQDSMRYPMHHVVGVLDTEQQVVDALRVLTGGGFLESEITIGCGTDMADRLRATTGRSGFAAQAIRFAHPLGMVNEEGEAKARYERAMRTVIPVRALGIHDGEPASCSAPPRVGQHCRGEAAARA